MVRKQDQWNIFNVFLRVEKLLHSNHNSDFSQKQDWPLSIWDLCDPWKRWSRRRKGKRYGRRIWRTVSQANIMTTVYMAFQCLIIIIINTLFYYLSNFQLTSVTYCFKLPFVSSFWWCHTYPISHDASNTIKICAPYLMTQWYNPSP